MRQTNREQIPIFAYASKSLMTHLGKKKKAQTEKGDKKKKESDACKKGVSRTFIVNQHNLIRHATGGALSFVRIEPFPSATPRHLNKNKVRKKNAKGDCISR